MTTLRELRGDVCDLCLDRIEGRWWSHKDNEINAVGDQRCCFDCRGYTASNDREDDLIYTEEIWRRWPSCVTRNYWRDWGEPEKVQSQSLAP